MMTLRKYSLMTLGGLAFAAGAVGLFVPLLPTTVFWLVAAWCFARSHTGWKTRLYAHPRFGRILSDFLEDGTASRGVKKSALVGMTTGFAVSALLIGLRPLVLVPVALVLMGIGVWVASRPNPTSRPEPLLRPFSDAGSTTTGQKLPQRG